VAFGPDRRRLWVGNCREWKIPRAAGRDVVLRGEGASFGDQEAIGGDAECGVMMEAAPPGLMRRSDRSTIRHAAIAHRAANSSNSRNNTPSNEATTSRPSTRANWNKLGLHSVGTTERILHA
jgi:hypothetical protein